MPLLLRLLPAAVAGAAVAAAFEPFALVVLLPLGVAGLSLLLRGASPAQGFLVGATFGTAFMLVLLPWLRVIGPDAWVALSVLEGVFYGLLGAGAALVQERRWWPLWTALLWVAVEALRSSVPFGGFPWGRLSFAIVDTPAAALFPYAGAAGTTFVVALVGTALAWAVVEARRVPVQGVAAVVAPLALIGAAGALSPWSARDAEPTGEVRVAAVQGDVPGEGMAAFAERRRVLENHVAATHALAADVDAGRVERPDLVVWPENSTDIDPFADPTVRADIQGAVDAVGVPVLVGAMVGGADPSEVFNQGIVWEPGTGPGQTYSKNHPVPFGEYIPLRDALAPLIGRLDQIPRDMVPGTEPGLLEMGGATVGDVICFEVAYDDVVHEVTGGGADLVVVQTNNATYMGTGQIEQQFAISRLRAMETNRYVVVAATNGVSGVIAPSGDVVERAPVRSRSVLLRSLPVYGTQTFAVRWGSTLEVLLGVAAAVPVLMSGLVLYRRRRVGRAGSATPQQPVPAGKGDR